MSATVTRAKQKQLDMGIFALIPLMLAAQNERHVTHPVGRVPMLDDVCSECAFDFNGYRVTQTFAYIVTEEVTYTEKQSEKGDKVHIKATRKQVWHEVHWCPRHQHEVIPLKHGQVHAARSTVEEAFAEVNIMHKGNKINGL